jgi:putative RecB family exonuclease
MSGESATLSALGRTVLAMSAQPTIAPIAPDLAPLSATGVTPAVRDGSASRGRSLSPSRAADFKSCPLRYRLRVVDRVPEPPSRAALRGTLVHAVLEGLFDLPAGQRTPTAAINALGPAWQDLRLAESDAAELFAGAESGEEAAWLTSAEDLLNRYFALEDPRRIEPSRREEYVEHALESGLVLRGIIDRLDEAPNGALRVVDYKTGKSPGENWEAKALFQLKFYALVLWRTRGVVPTVLQLLYLADEQRLTYSPDEKELEAFERQLHALWRAIESALASGDFRTSKGPLCKFCSYQSLCPEFGGAPPPYPRFEPAESAEPAERASTSDPVVAGVA